MSDCFIFKTPLGENKIRTVKAKGIKTLIERAVAKKYAINEQFNTTLLPPDTMAIKAHTCGISANTLCSCNTLTRVDNIKYLGIIIDNRLSWNAQIENLISRIRKLIFVFKKLRASAEITTLKTVYFALAESILGYCITSWGGACKTNLLRLKRAQRCIFKIMMHKPIKFPTSDLYSQCKLLSVRKLFILKTILQKHSEVVFDHKIVDNKRRSDRVCDTFKYTTATAGRQYYFLSPKLYNKVNKVLKIYTYILRM
ncbi:hypothetical protein O3G_MSEX000597 [Manduca sexta]|nr:hypothetical protein O3G_MSEX000597 [Manduca sexta]